MFIFVKICTNEGKIARFDETRRVWKPSQLAEMLGINPAGISHILKDRNKPSFDLLQKILRRFPQINPDWLLLDSTRCIATKHTGIPRHPHRRQRCNFPSTAIYSGRLAPMTPRSRLWKPTRREPEAFAAADQSVSDQFPVSRTGANVQRVVLFYDDQTFEKFHADKALKFFVEKIPRNIPRTKSQNPDTNNQITLSLGVPFLCPGIGTQHAARLPIRMD